MQATPAPSAELFAAPQANSGRSAPGTTSEAGESFSSHLATETAAQQVPQQQTLRQGQITSGKNSQSSTPEPPQTDSDDTITGSGEKIETDPVLETSVAAQLAVNPGINQPVAGQIQQHTSGQTKQVESLLENLLQGASQKVSAQDTIEPQDAKAALQQVLPENNLTQNRQPLLATHMSQAGQQGITQDQLQWIIDNAKGLQQNTSGAQFSQQVAGDATETIAAALPSALNQLQRANGETPAVIQQWSAQYSSAQAAQEAPTAEIAASRTQGQVITVYQTGEGEEFTLRAAPVSQNGMQHQSGQRLDATGNFIQSHMPTNSVQNAFGNQSEQPFGEENGSSAQNPNPGTLQAEQVKAGDLQAGKEAPQVLFATEATQVSTLPQAPQTTAPGSSFIKLPSGFTVPEGTVMDQVINHFSANLKLESGSISLKLYPQELGQLQMEIEVKNDNIKAHITAQNPQAQEALDRHLPRLKEALAQQGFELSQVEITIAASDKYDGQQFQENLERHQLAQSYKSGSGSSYTNAEGDETEESLSDEQQSLSVTV